MLSENLLKCICLFTFIGLIAGNDAKTVRKNPFSARPYAWNDLACRGRPDGFHPHRNGCEWWLNCLGGSFVAEGSCSDGENFNHNNGQCNSIGSFDCFDDFENYYDDVEPIEPDSGCPPNGSNQLVFLESDYCEDFFICLNGQAVPQTCRDGLHWNVKDSICDFPENAGCEVRNKNECNYIYNVKLNMSNFLKTSSLTSQNGCQHAVNPILLAICHIQPIAVCLCTVTMEIVRFNDARISFTLIGF